MKERQDEPLVAKARWLAAVYKESLAQDRGLRCGYLGVGVMLERIGKTKDYVQTYFSGAQCHNKGMDLHSVAVLEENDAKVHACMHAGAVRLTATSSLGQGSR